MIAPIPSRPAGSYDEAVERARAVMALDGEAILPVAHTALLEHGKRTPLAVVLFHGITNNPAQYSEFAPLLHARGVNVFVPRMPEHGYKNRMWSGIAKITAEQILTAATEAVDIAAGLGERVGVLGISMGGSLSAYFGQHRALDVAVPVAPDFSLLQLPYGLSRLIGSIMLALPNFFLWWDARVRDKQEPFTAYPRFSTHALMQSLRIGDDVHAAVRRERQLAKRIVTVVNRCDPAVNNEVTQSVVTEWMGWNRSGTEYVVMRNLPENHDIVDPRNPNARTKLVYPKLLDILTA